MMRISKNLKRISLIHKLPSFFSYQPNSNEIDSHTHELQDEHYLSLRKEEFKNYYTIKPSNRIPGFATSEGTLFYSQSRKEYVNEKHFRKPYHDELFLSSIGIGTYVGAPDENDDIKVIFNIKQWKFHNFFKKILDVQRGYR